MIAVALTLVVGLADRTYFPYGHFLRGDGAGLIRDTAFVLLGVGMAAAAILIARLTGELWIRAMSRGNPVKPAKRRMPGRSSRSRR